VLDSYEKLGASKKIREGVCELSLPLGRGKMKIDYVVSTITFDHVKSRTIECMELARWLLFRQDIAFYWNVMYGDGKARSRSISASRFLTVSEAKYLIFIDSDILFTPENLKRIFEDLRAGYDLVGGIFAVRGGTQPSSYAYNAVYHLDGKINEFEYLSSGFMGISRKLLKKMVDEIPLPFLHPKDLKFWPFFEEKQYPDREGEGIFLSEDYDFCEKARSVGIKTYVDSSIQLGHLGEYVFTLTDVIRHQKGIREKAEKEAKEKGLGDIANVKQVAIDSLARERSVGDVREEGRTADKAAPKPSKNKRGEKK